MKRFWDAVTIQPWDRGHAILLDGKPMHLPGGAVLIAASPGLAQAIAAEWQAAGSGKGGEMSFANTPLTRIAGTAQERIAPAPGPVVDALLRYAETDLLCYRAKAPSELVHRQAQAWQPLLDWAALAYDAPLRVTAGIMHAPQDRQALGALRRAVGALDVGALAALAVAVPVMGSLVLGLALAAGRVDAATAHELAALDELFQAEQWGEDAEAAARRRQVAADVSDAARFMALSRS